MRPFVNQIVQEGFLLRLGFRFGICLQCCGKCGRKGCRFTQIAQTADALQVCRRTLFVGQIDGLAITAVKRIVAKQQIAHFAHIAVFAGIAAFLRQTVTIAKILIGILICNIQRLYADFFQRKQLLFLADTILIQIAPYAQFVKVSIFGIDHAVAIRIIFRQSRIAVRRLRAVFQNGTVAEKLLAVIDDAVAVAVNNQQTVV